MRAPGTPSLKKIYYSHDFIIIFVSTRSGLNILTAKVGSSGSSCTISSGESHADSTDDPSWQSKDYCAPSHSSKGFIIHYPLFTINTVEESGDKVLVEAKM